MWPASQNIPADWPRLGVTLRYWGVLGGESAEALGRLVSTWAAARADDGAAAVAADRRVAQSAQHAQRGVGHRRPAERAEAVRRVVLAQLVLVGMLHKRRGGAVHRRSAHAPARPRLPAAVVRVFEVARPV